MLTDHQPCGPSLQGQGLLLGPKRRSLRWRDRSFHPLSALPMVATRGKNARPDAGSVNVQKRHARLHLFARKVGDCAPIAPEWLIPELHAEYSQDARCGQEISDALGEFGWPKVLDESEARSSGSCAPRSVSPGSGASRASVMRAAISWPRSTPGSLRA